MELYVVIEQNEGTMRGETIGVFISKEKAINKIISLNKQCFDQLDESVQKERGGWNEYEKITRDELEKENCAYGIYFTEYEIKKHQLD